MTRRTAAGAFLALLLLLVQPGVSQTTSASGGSPSDNWLALTGWLLVADAADSHQSIPPDQRADEYVCRFTAQAPEIDGDPSDPCWPRADSSPVFYRLGRVKEAYPDRVQVRFLRDQTDLYAAVDAECRPGSQPKSRPNRGRDTGVHQDDSVTFYIIEIGSPPEADLDCVGMIITNDLGFVPRDGYTDFMLLREDLARLRRPSPPAASD